jgi:N-acetylmuramic acid 6-phosphate etherase
MSVLEIVTAMNEEDAGVASAVRAFLPEVARAAAWARDAFLAGGRLIYLGAGTSGRLGVLDAAECPPTFGVPAGQVVGLLAGGNAAMFRAVEGAEDSAAGGADDLKALDLRKEDFVVGIAASGRTLYVLGGLRYASSIGCHTAAIACNRNSEIGAASELAIEPVTGPEVLTGSTRLKAGTAQKQVLNMISTASMVGIGKAYQNLMVDVVQSNEKLRARAERIVAEATGAEVLEVREALAASGGKVKTAIVMLLLGCSVSEAESRLCQSEGHIRGALGLHHP